MRNGQLENILEEGVERDIYLFFHRLKPAVYLSEAEAVRFEAHMQRYPYLSFAIGGNVNRLYFQDEPQLNAFAAEHALEKGNVNHGNHVLVGIALGFPLEAVTAFSLRHVTKRVIVDYHGVVFTCHEADTEACLCHMETHYPFPNSFQTGITLKVKVPGSTSWTEQRLLR